MDDPVSIIPDDLSRAAFEQDGFVVLDDVLTIDTCAVLNDRLEKVLRGECDGMRGRADKAPKPMESRAKPGKVAAPLGGPSKQTLQVINIWKADRAYERVVCSPTLGKAVAALGGWAGGARVANDQVWAKPPGAAPLTFHRDSAYFDFEPSEVITVWIALDDMSEELGPLQYVHASHKWADGRKGSANQFFDTRDRFALLHDAARREGVTDPAASLRLTTLRRMGATDGLGIHRLGLICTLLLTLSGAVLVPPVLYGAIASSVHTAQAHVTALMPAAYALGSFVVAMPASLFMERYGVHRSFMLGVACHALFATAQAFCSQLWQLVALQAGLGASHSFAGTVGYIAFCNAWFGDWPSTAIATTFAAFGAAGILWTPAAAALTAAHGWRAAIGAVAAAAWLVALPLAVCCMRDPPPSAPVRRPSRVARGASLELGEASAGAPWWLADASVAWLALLSFCVLFVVYGVNNSVTLCARREPDPSGLTRRRPLPAARDPCRRSPATRARAVLVDAGGVPLKSASLFTSLLFLCNMIAKLAAGPLLDSRRGGTASVGACALLAGGSALLCSLAWRPAAGAAAMALFAVVFGLGYGMSFALVQSKAALHFGHRRGFKALQGFLYSWQMAGTICGDLLTPELAHVFGYSTAFAVLAGVAATALGAIAAFEARERSIGAASLVTTLL